MGSTDADLRILLFGSVSADLRGDLARIAGGTDIMVAAPERSPFDEIAANEPDLIVVGEQAPGDARSFARAESERRVIPVLSVHADTEADVWLPPEPAGYERALRAAARMARLHRAAVAGANEGFEQRLRHEFSRAVRYRHPVSLVLLAVDRGDGLRQTYGTGALEQFHLVLEERLRRCLRDVDLLFRASGEEFCAILPETPATGGELVAERFRSQTSRLIFKPDAGAEHRTLPLKATSSVGVADGPGETVASAGDLRARAHESVDAARRSGGDRVAVHGAVRSPSEGAGSG